MSGSTQQNSRITHARNLETTRVDTWARHGTNSRSRPDGGVSKIAGVSARGSWAAETGTAPRSPGVPCFVAVRGAGRSASPAWLPAAGAAVRLRRRQRWRPRRWRRRWCRRGGGSPPPPPGRARRTRPSRPWNGSLCAAAAAAAAAVKQKDIQKKNGRAWVRRREWKKKCRSVFQARLVLRAHGRHIPALPPAAGRPGMEAWVETSPSLRTALPHISRIRSK